MNLRIFGNVAAACLVATTIGIMIPAGAAASSATENPWAAEHIEKLPPDIRREISRRERACGSGALAGHYFAVSIEGRGRRFVSLHFKASHARTARRYVAATPVSTNSSPSRAAGI